MLRKIKFLTASALLFGVVAMPGTVFAGAQIESALCQGATNLEITPVTGTDATQCATDANDGDLNALITKVINIISIIVAIVAVIMIIIGGFKYITSGGDSGKVTSAKNTILYAIIGLVLVGIAQFVVKFVIGQSSTLVT